MIRLVVITGASDGIGAEVARQLAEKEGGKLALVLAARNAAQLDQKSIDPDTLTVRGAPATR
jgi:short-subunit dehydrogenase